MPIHDCFAGLFPEMSKKGVSGVSGVATTILHNQINNITETQMQNTHNPQGVSGVATAKNETPETHSENGLHQKGVSTNSIRNQCLTGTETPATPETPQNHYSQTCRDIFAERAAIMEYEGGLSRHDARAFAYADTFMHFVTTCYPAIRAEFDAMVTNPPLI